MCALSDWKHLTAVKIIQVRRKRHLTHALKRKWLTDVKMDRWNRKKKNWEPMMVWLRCYQQNVSRRMSDSRTERVPVCRLPFAALRYYDVSAWVMNGAGAWKRYWHVLTDLKCYCPVTLRSWKIEEKKKPYNTTETVLVKRHCFPVMWGLIYSQCVLVLHFPLC